MPTEEHLKMLSAKALNMNVTGGDASTAPFSLSWEDIAGALSRVQHAPSALFGRVCIAGQTRYLAELERAMLLDVERRALVDVAAHEWVLDKPGRLRSMIRLAIIEYGVGLGECGRCDGSGEVASTECRQCNGTGVGRFSQRQRANAAGVSREQWRKRWNRRYNALIVPAVLDYQRDLWEAVRA